MAEREYNLFPFPVGSSNVNFVKILCCSECGALVANRYTHNEFHDQRGELGK